jgi:hypothetical protein
LEIVHGRFNSWRTSGESIVVLLKIKQNMGWSFGGIAIKKDYSESFDALFHALDLKRKDTRSAFNFPTAISKENRRTAVSIVNEHTLLLDHLLPYNCSYEENSKSQFDKTLEKFSNNLETLVFMLHSISGTYSFSLFAEGKCKRRWSAEPGNILCNDGKPLQAEIPFITGTVKNSGRFSSENEARIITIFETFMKTGFNELLDDEDTVFRLFI